jgi:phage-related protein
MKTKIFGIKVFYHTRESVVYILQCFRKKTTQTSQSDIEIGRKRLSELKQRLAKTKRR